MSNVLVVADFLSYGYVSCISDVSNYSFQYFHTASNVAICYFRLIIPHMLVISKTLLWKTTSAQNHQTYPRICSRFTFLSGTLAHTVPKHHTYSVQPLFQMRLASSKQSISARFSHCPMVVFFY
jgi:hypothetical protein